MRKKGKETRKRRKRYLPWKDKGILVDRVDRRGTQEKGRL